MADNITRPIWSEDRRTLSNVLLKDSNLYGTYNVVTTWWDGSPMDDTKLDEDLVYVKYEGSYLLQNFEYGQVLQKDTVADLRALTPKEILLLRLGVYKHVQLNGYYAKGDTPTPIDYYLSDTTEEDDGGSVFEVGGVKLEHEFVGEINVTYFGAVPNDQNNFYTDNIQKALNYKTNFTKSVYVPKGKFYIDKQLRVYSNTNFFGAGKYVTEFIQKEPSTETHYVIELWNGENISVHDFKVTGNKNLTNSESFAIVTFATKNLEIYNTYITDSFQGIRVGYSATAGYSENFKVYNNTIKGITKNHGIEIIRARKGVVYSNNISDVRQHGIRLVGCVDTTVYSNSIESAINSSVYMGAFGGSLGYEKIYRTMVFSNNIKLTTRVGVGCTFKYGSENCSFFDNIIENVYEEDDDLTGGINLSDLWSDISPELRIFTKGSQVYSNIIKGCKTGIVAERGAINCNIYNNKLINIKDTYSISFRESPANFHGTTIDSNIIFNNNSQHRGIVIDNGVGFVMKCVNNSVHKPTIDFPFNYSGIVLTSSKQSLVSYTTAGSNINIPNIGTRGIYNNISPGDRVRFYSDGIITSPLQPNQNYYITPVRGSQSQFKLSNSYQDFIDEVYITFSAGEGVQYMQLVDMEETNSVQLIDPIIV